MEHAILIVSPVLGVLLGEYNGVAFWSKLDGDDEQQDFALIFPDETAAEAFRSRVAPLDRCETVSLDVPAETLRAGYIAKEQIYKYW